MFRSIMQILITRKQNIDRENELLGCIIDTGALNGFLTRFTTSCVLLSSYFENKWEGKVGGTVNGTELHRLRSFKRDMSSVPTPILSHYSVCQTKDWICPSMRYLKCFFPKYQDVALCSIQVSMLFLLFWPTILEDTSHNIKTTETFDRMMDTAMTDESTFEWRPEIYIQATGSKFKATLKSQSQLYAYDMQEYVCMYLVVAAVRTKSLKTKVCNSGCTHMCILLLNIWTP